jgi:hypothetical protein
VNLILIEGVLRKKLSKMSVVELLSSSVEFSRVGARPLVRVYSKADCQRLFKNFAAISVKKYHWKSDQIPFFGHFLPAFLPPILGWYIFTFAIKAR